ncbi:hypothetical protein NIES2119_06310 [[Phormidium ambiguum] IAM M-71]|uniref:Lipoprotein n=1 Tax=[Phormidium ambiguum] IAM M-71 TaxID=454136 RepID=A0A1U7IPK4_9CYAN|nr:hypothetical protein [Phormidium ambiguum]OKH39350.1 hypothetical protein NIES2119_06310 [Phormidium ambiguum IAM M-71]
MMSIKSLLIVLSSLSLIFLGACASNNQATNPGSTPTSAASPELTAQQSNVTKTESSGHTAKPLQGGQVVESGPYHLEFVPIKESKGFHLDFYLQKGDNHETIPNAKVTAQVQLPDGTEKTILLPYDAAGKHYAAVLPETASGQYNVKITSEIGGEKVDGRFSFNR